MKSFGVRLGLVLVMAGALQAQEAAPGWQIAGFVRGPVNPVITPRKDTVFQDPMRGGPVHWEALHTFNPAAVVKDGKIYVLYRAEDDSGTMEIGGHTSRLGLATSEDGVTFTRRTEPVFYPAKDAETEREWPGGVEDPRIVEREDGTYVLTYTQWNHKTYDSGVATSKDLMHWTKWGPIFGHAAKAQYRTMQYKSSGIVTKLVGGRLIAAKIKGKYWMYWGEGVVRLATSDDLIHWEPVEDANGVAVEVLAKRPGHFDSTFPEVGPPPMLTDRGIVVLYNGKNAAEGGDASIAAGSYAAGEALFAGDDPTKLLARREKPVFKPEMAFEKSGQYAAGTTFVEGLVWFKGKWVLLYGCADSLVGVAVGR